eukprot:466506-Amorphochlora_amoeboformis.AAC.1
MGIGVHLRNKYTKKGVLGRGAFARVWRVEDRKTKKLYAAKSIPKVRNMIVERIILLRPVLSLDLLASNAFLCFG